MGPKGAGIAEIEAGSAVSVAVTGTGIVYALNAPSTLAVYNICGSQVASAAVQGEGVYDISGLTKGIYIYSVAGKSGKFIVK